MHLIRYAVFISNTMFKTTIKLQVRTIGLSRTAGAPNGVKMVSSGSVVEMMNVPLRAWHFNLHLSSLSELKTDFWYFVSLSLFFFLNSKDDKLLAVFQSSTFIFHVWIFIWLSNTCAWITTEERDIIHTNLEKVFPHLWLKINTKERKWIALKSALTV